MNGWIKLHKKILENPVLFHDTTAYLVFTRILLKADSRTGVYTTGRFMLAELTRLKPTTAWAALKRLERASIVRLESDNKMTSIYICKWSEYQSSNDNKMTTKRQQNDTNKEIRNKNKEDTKVSATPAVYGNPDINEVIEKFQQTLNLKLNRVKAQRQAASNLIKRYSLPVVLRAIDAVAACRDAEFAPRILSVEDLWSKWNNLEAFYRKEQTKQKGKVVVIEDE